MLKSVVVMVRETAARLERWAAADVTDMNKYGRPETAAAAYLFLR